MHSDVEASGMVPSESSYQHGPPLLRRVRVPFRSPTSSLLCGPPTPSPPSVAAPVAPCRRPTTRYPWSDEGLPGAWGVLFQRATLPNPVRCANCSPVFTRSALLPSSVGKLSAQEMPELRGYSRGPLARAPTHRRARYRTRRKARYRPAGLSFGRAGFAPAGRHTGFQVATASLPSLLTSLAWSHTCPGAS